MSAPEAEVMDAQVVTLRFSEHRGEMETGPLKEALRNRELLGVREHFFVAGGVPYLTLLLETRPLAPAEAGSRPEASSEPARGLEVAAEGEAAKGMRERSRSSKGLARLVESLGEDERELFEALRAWRQKVAVRDGVPPYLVFTNAELGEICRRRPAGVNGLREIPGIGRGKCEAHGRSVLGIVAQFAARSARAGVDDRERAQDARDPHAKEPSATREPTPQEVTHEAEGRAGVGEEASERSLVTPEAEVPA